MARRSIRADSTWDPVLAHTSRPPHGERILGYDNAHAFRQAGKSRGAGLPARDHRHRHTSDSGTAYEFKSAQQLLEDFFADADRILAELSKP